MKSIHLDRSLLAIAASMLAANASGATIFTNYNLGYASSVYADGGYLYAGRGNAVYVSSDNGVNWTARSTDNPIASVYASGGYLYAGSSYTGFTSGGLSVSADNGATWTNYTSANSGLGSGAVTSISAYGGYLYAGTYGGVNGGGGVSVSTNNGANWTSSPIGTNHVRSVFAENGYVYSGNDGGWPLAVSTNSGASWTSRQVGFGYSARQVFSKNGTLFLLNEYELWASSNHGVSWSNLLTNYYNGYRSSFYLSMFADDSRIYLGTYAGLSVSSDGGNTWTDYNTANSGVPTNVNSIFAKDGYLYLATNSGVSVASISSLGGLGGGGGAVPEPSTYGLALGGLALVGAVIRRRKISK